MITIKEAKVEKTILESQIGKLISEFEQTYNLKVEDIEITERMSTVVGVDHIIIKAVVEL